MPSHRKPFKRANTTSTKRNRNLFLFSLLAGVYTLASQNKNMPDMMRPYAITGILPSISDTGFLNDSSSANQNIVDRLVIKINSFGMRFA